MRILALLVVTLALVSFGCKHEHWTLLPSQADDTVAVVDNEPAPQVENEPQPEQPVEPEQPAEPEPPAETAKEIIFILGVDGMD